MVVWTDRFWLYATALLYIVPVSLLVWVVGRALLRELPPETKRTNWLALAILLVTALAMGFRQLYFDPSWMTRELMLVIKDTALVFNALGVVMVTNLLTRSPGSAASRLQVTLAFIVVLIDFGMWHLGLLLWPTAPVMLYGLWCYGFVARTFLRYSNAARNAHYRWQFRSLAWGFAVACLYVFGRAWQTELFPPEFRLVLGIVNRTTLVTSSILVCLGFVMPRWYAFLGTRLEILWHSQRYYDQLIGLLALLHDQRWSVTDHQRMGLAHWATEVAVALKVPPGTLDVIHTAAQVAPIQFVRYNGQDITHHEPGNDEANTVHDPLATMHHFSRVYQAVRALLQPGRLDPADPLEAHIIRATALALDGRTQSEIAEQTLAEVAEAVSTIVSQRSDFSAATEIEPTSGG